MIFSFKIGKVQMVATAENSEEYTKFSFLGPEKEIARVKEFLEYSHGPFGHTVINEDYSRAGDIYFALARSDFKWVMEQGELIPFESAPEGCVS